MKFSGSKPCSKESPCILVFESEKERRAFGNMVGYAQRENGMGDYEEVLGNMVNELGDFFEKEFSEDIYF